MEAVGGRDVERRIALKRTRLFADVEAVLDESADSDGGDGGESDSHARSGQPDLDPSKVCALTRTGAPPVRPRSALPPCRRA